MCVEKETLYLYIQDERCNLSPYILGSRFAFFSFSEPKKSKTFYSWPFTIRRLWGNDLKGEKTEASYHAIIIQCIESEDSYVFRL